VRLSRAQPRWRLAFVLSLLVQAVVLYAPSGPPAGELHGIDKLVHLGVFALPVAAGLLGGLPARWVVVPLALHAPVSELVQHYFLPHRDGDVLDALADLGGVGLGALAAGLWRRPRG